MRREVQAFWRREARPKPVGAWLALACAGLVAGCASGGNVLARAEIDHSIVTASIGEGDASPLDAARDSDARTIQNAVTSANLASLGGSPLPWANVDTGSAGAVSQIAEFADEGTSCRSFVASREAFDGIALYKGDACLEKRGVWRLRAFTPL